MTDARIYVFGILGVAVLLFASGRLRGDVVALLVVLALVLLDVLTLREGLAGFGDPVIIMMAGLFVVGEALVTTGLAFVVGAWLMRMGRGSEARLLVLLMLVVGAVAAFIGSTGAAALFLPIVLGIANRTDFAPRRLLMPLAFAGLIGGMLTLIGAPANLVINAELRNQGLDTFNFFDFTPIGAAVLVTAIGFMLLSGRRLLTVKDGKDGAAREKPLTLDQLAERYGLDKQLHRLRIPASSGLVGKSIAFLQLRSNFGIASVGVERRRGRRHVVRPALAETVFSAGDVFYAIGSEDAASHFIESMGLEPLDLESAPQKTMYEELGVAEVLLPPGSDLVQKTLGEIDFRTRYHVSVLAVRRRSEAIKAGLSNTSLKSGDRLLVSGGWKDIALLREHKSDMIVLTLPLEMADFAPKREKAYWALGIVAVMVAAMVLGLAPNAVCVLVAALALIGAGCLTMEAAYGVVRWSSLVLVAGMLPLATALQKTGGTEAIVAALTATFGGLSATALMAALFVLTALLTTFISSTATALLLAPIAIGLAMDMGVSPYAFAMTVAIAASTGFMTPVSSSANTLVTAPGGYSFADFAKMGVPMAVLTMLLTVLLAPLLFPF